MTGRRTGPTIRPGDDVTIVGGGLLGLTLAWRLIDAGATVTVLEARPELGGLAAAWTIDTATGPITWDRYYHVTLESDLELLGLLGELGLREDIRWTTTATGYWSHGQLVPVSTPRDFLRLPGLSLVAKARLAATIGRGATIRNWRALEAITAAEWLRRWSGRATFDRFWVPLLAAKLGDAWTEANAAFIWATIRRLTAARRAGIGTERFGAVLGGYARVLETFAAGLTARGATVRTNAPVGSITAGPDGVVVATDDGSLTKTDHVIVTTTPRVAADLIEGLDGARLSQWQPLRYQGVICLSVVLERPLAPYYLTYLMDALPFTAIVEMTTLVPPAWFGGRSLVYLPRYVAGDDPRWERTDAEIECEFLAALRQVHPVADTEVLATPRASRTREVFPLPVVDYSTRVPSIDTGVPGVHLVSSAQIVNGTLNVNETVGLAERAAASLLGRADPLVGSGG